MAEFVSGSLDSVIFWETKTYTRKRNAQPFPNSCPLSSLTWNSANTKLAVVPKHGDRIAICEFHESIMTWSFLTNSEGGDFTTGCLLRNSRYLASGSSDSVIRIWDLKNKNMFRSLPGHTSPVRSIARSHNDHWLASGGEDGSIMTHMVDSTSAPCHHLQDPVPGQKNVAINRLRFSQLEKGQFGSVGEDGVVCVWSVESQRKLHKFSSPHTDVASDLCFSPSNKMLMISVGMDAQVKCYDIQTRKVLMEVTAPSPLSSVAVLKDGITLLAGGTDGKLYVYELRNVKIPKMTLLGHKSAITSISQQSHSKMSSQSSRSSKLSSKGKFTPEVNAEKVALGGLAETPASISPHLFNSQSATRGQQEEGEEGDEEGRGGRGNNVNKKFISAANQQTSSIPFDFSTPNVTGSVVITPPSITHETGDDGGGRKASFIPNTKMVAVLPSSDHIAVVGGGADYVISTPNNTANSTGIFSPIDSIVTPLTRYNRPITTATTSATTLSFLPGQTKAPSSTTSTSTAFSKPTSGLPHTPHTNFTTDSSGIFSPLDSSAAPPPSLPRLASSWQPVASPLLVSRVPPAAAIKAGSVTGPVTTEGGLQGDGPPSFAGVLVESGRGLNHQKHGDLEDTDSGGGAAVSSCTLATSNSVPTKTEAIPIHQATMVDPRSTNSSGLPASWGSDYHVPLPVSRGFMHCNFSPHSDVAEASATSSVDIISPIPHSSASSMEKNEVTTPPLLSHDTATPSSHQVHPPTNGIQIKFVENIIRDAHEETIDILHEDIRALGVDLSKSVCALQHQIASQFAILMDKVERLDRDLEHVKKMIHQYMPKH